VTDGGPPLALADLSRHYGERRALDGVTFSLRPGELFGLLGPNGGGKTTLFRVVSTLLPPTSGAVRVLGNALPDHSAAVRESIGVVFQSPSLDVHLTVRENLVHQGHLYGLRGAELTMRIDAGLARFGLTDRAGDLVRELSGGLQRRVEIAKGLLHRPRLLLLDEPTTGLDPGARRDVWDHLARLRDEEDVACLVTTHLMEEAERCDRVAILNAGKLVALGSPHELLAALGGDVITAVPAHPDAIEAVRTRIGEELGVEMTAVGGGLHAREGAGAALVARLLETFGGELASVTVGRPTLEDVFLEKTGKVFE